MQKKANEEFLKIEGRKRAGKNEGTRKKKYWMERYLDCDEGLMAGREDGIEIGEKRGKKLVRKTERKLLPENYYYKKQTNKLF